MTPLEKQLQSDLDSMKRQLAAVMEFVGFRGEALERFQAQDELDQYMRTGDKKHLNSAALKLSKIDGKYKVPDMDKGGHENENKSS